MGESIRAVRDAIFSPKLWTILGAIATVAGAAWVQAVKVAMWVDSIPTAEEFKDALTRIDQLEASKDALAMAAFVEREQTTQQLGAIAGAAAARARPRDKHAAANARARFSALILGGTEPIAALDIVLREVGTR